MRIGKSSKTQAEPKILEFEIGAYESDSFKIVWEDGKLLLYTGFSHGYFEEPEALVPEEGQWKEFWNEMEKIRIWELAPDYTAPVMDGTGWSLELKHGTKSINADGHMAWPDPDDLSKAVEMKVTPPFEKLIQALNTLCGKEFIPN